MTIEQHNVGDVVVLDLIGPITGDASRLLHDKVHSLVFEGHHKLVINLAKVTHLDSAGLGALISCHTTLAKAGGRVVLTNIATRVSSVMAITKLLTVFDVADSEAGAVVSFSGPE